MEDSQIIDLYWQRSSDAITESTAKYGSYCHAIALRILGSRLDAEECVNGTWVGAWNAMPVHRPPVRRETFPVKNCGFSMHFYFI